MTEWYIYQASGNPAGPFSTDLLARGIVAGKVERDAYVAQPGDPQWTEILQQPEIAEAVARHDTSGPPSGREPIHTIPPAPPPLKTETPTIVLPLFVPQPPAPPEESAEAAPQEPAEQAPPEPPAPESPKPPSAEAVVQSLTRTDAPSQDRGAVTQPKLRPPSRPRKTNWLPAVILIVGWVLAIILFIVSR